jgi:Serine phosphatase RsbU, regulator of sigma subunit
VTMTQGEAMLLYTDGVTEAWDENEIFGDARLIEVLKGCAGLDPKSIIEKVEGAVLDFGGEARDDIALLALRAD